MLIRCVVLGLTALFSLSAVAQGPATKAPIAPAGAESPPPAQDAAPNPDRDSSKLVYIDPTLTKGSSIKLEISTTKEMSSKGNKPEKRHSSVDVLIEVLDVAEDGTSKIAWTQTIPNAAATAKAMVDDPMAAMLLAMDGLRLEFGLTADGELTALDNFDAVQKRLITVVEGTIEKRRQAGTSEESLAAVRKMVTELYSDEALATATLMKEPGLYFQIYGYELEAGKPLEYETELGNPLGGAPYPAAGTWRLDGFNSKASPPAKLVKVRWQQQVDEKQAIKIMVETLRSMAEKVGKPVPEDEAAKLKQMQFEISDDGTYTYNRETGFIESLRYKRMTVVDEKRSSETVTMRVKE